MDIGSGMTKLAGELFDVNYVSVEKELAELDPELDSFVVVEDEGSLEAARSRASVRVNRLKKSD